MKYFAALLSATAYSLRLPKSLRDDVSRYVRQHKKGPANPEQAPFRRQLDFWAYSVAVAVSEELEPVDAKSARRGHPFVDTRSVQMPDDLCALLAVVTAARLGPDQEGLAEPGQIIEFGNRLAAAGCRLVLRELRDGDLRLTPLDKVRAQAESLFGKSGVAAAHGEVAPEDTGLETAMEGGESETVEFKSTLRVNLYTGKRDEEMESAVLKTLAAFLNTDGGTLVVGVADDGSATGIEADGFKSEDEMSRHLVNKVRDRMDVSVVTSMRLQFASHRGSRVFVVRCARSSVPVFVRDSKRASVERFYIRTGPATTELPASKTQSYIRQRFDS